MAQIAEKKKRGRVLTTTPVSKTSKTRAEMWPHRATQQAKKGFSAETEQARTVAKRRGVTKKEKKEMIAAALGISGVAAATLLPSLIFGTTGITLARGAQKIAPTALKKLNKIYKQLQKTTMEAAKAPGTKRMNIKGKETEVKVPKQEGYKKVGGQITAATYMHEEVKEAAKLAKEYGPDVLDLFTKLATLSYNKGGYKKTRKRKK